MQTKFKNSCTLINCELDILFPRLKDVTNDYLHISCFSILISDVSLLQSYPYMYEVIKLKTPEDINITKNKARRYLYSWKS